MTQLLTSPATPPAEAFDEEAVIRRLETDPLPLEFDGEDFVEKDVSFESSEANGQIMGVFFSHVHTLPAPKPVRLFDAECIYRCWPDRPRMFRKPDVSLIRSERLPPVTSRLPRVSQIAPDLAVEVVSPNEAFDDVFAKVALYQEAGVPAVWTVSLTDRSILVHTPDGDVTVYRGDDAIPVGPLPGFEPTPEALLPPRG